MDDYISRQAAIEVCDWWQHEYDESASRIDDIIHCIAEDIEKLPSANVVEVVRCCDCKYFRNNTEFGYPWCDRRRNADLFVSGLDYCSYAERRIDGEIH